MNTTSAAPNTAAKPTRKRRTGPPQTFFASLPQFWRVLTGTQQAAYAVLGARMAGTGADATGKPLTAYQCFLSLSAGRARLGLQPLPTPPAVPDTVPYLEDVTLSATLADTPGPSYARLRLVLRARPIDTPVQVTFAPPSPLIDAPPAASKFKSVGTVAGIGDDGVDITALFPRNYWKISSGVRIAVRVTPLSPQGFRGQAVTALGKVTLAPPGE